MNKLLFFIIGILFVTSCKENKNEADAYGNFEAEEHYVSSKSMGEIHGFLIEKGQSLEKGYLAGVIDTSQFEIQKKQLLAKKSSILTSTNEIEAQINTIRTKIDNLIVNRDRVKIMVDNKASSIQNLDNINSEIDVSEKQIKQARARKESVLSELRVLSSQEDLINKQINDCKVINPITGTVLEKFIENNEFCILGKPIYKIADLNNLLLKAYISARQLSAINIGQDVKVAIDGPDEGLKFYVGTISWISSEAEFTPKVIQTPEDRLNLVYAIKIKVINDGSIKIGMPGQVYLTTK